MPKMLTNTTNLTKHIYYCLTFVTFTLFRFTKIDWTVL